MLSCCSPSNRSTRESFKQRARSLQILYDPVNKRVMSASKHQPEMTPRHVASELSDSAEMSGRIERRAQINGSAEQCREHRRR